MKKDNFQFYSGGKEYIFWVWKGDYLNLGAGAELGIYTKCLVYGRSCGHWIVQTKLAMPMTMALKLNGRIISRYKPTTKQWWITSFNPCYQNVKAGNLTAIFNVSFSSNKTMFNDFYKKYGVGANKDTRWKFNRKKFIATLTF